MNRNRSDEDTFANALAPCKVVIKPGRTKSPNPQNNPVRLY